MGAGGVSDATKFQFTNASVPQAYEAMLVPRVFEPWGRRLLELADLRPGASVLDIATGPGTVARLASVRVGPGGRVVGVDISEPMLAIARAKPQPRDGCTIEYRVSGAAPLAVESGAFDMATCQQGLQFFPDRQAALREMRRALRSGGTAAVAVWAEIGRNALFNVYLEALRETTGEEPASLMAAPFEWSDPDALAGAMREAGFSDVRVVTESLPLRFEGGPDQFVAAFAATPIAPMIAALPESDRNRFDAALRAKARPFVQDGAVVGLTTTHIATGRA